MSYHVIREKKYRVAALSSIDELFQSNSPVLDFLQEQARNANNASSCKGLIALFDRFAEQGPAGLPSGCIHEANKKDAILEFIKGSLRILYFMEGNTAFLVHGYIKKSQKTPSSETNKVAILKNDFMKNRKR